MKTLDDKVITQAEFRRRHCDDVVLVGGFIWRNDVKEFIKEILETPLKEVWQMKALIKNKAGDALCTKDVAEDKNGR